MKRLFLIILAASLALCFCACGGGAGTEAPKDSQTDPQTEAPESETAPLTGSPESETAPQTEAPETDPPLTVSPLASEDFLLPFDDYSWEREYAPEMIVLHFTSAVVLDRENPYDLEKVRSTFEDAKVSTNYIVDRDGTVLCYLPENRAAWHAGKGSYGGDARYENNLNRYSFGIEIVGIGSQDDMSQYLTKAEYDSLDPSLIGFTNAQYEAVKALVRDLCTRYEIPQDRTHVIGHEEYSSAKADPGELFDWNRVIG